jgi:hypothetical protein
MQNMDELTVTTVARGLAKVVRLLPEEWQLILFFHGEDDLERFRREVPAAEYFLPWLSPAQHGDVPPIERDPRKSCMASEIQDISEMLRVVPV